MSLSICTIITARNSATTIGDAVRSALVQPEVTEVVVVDDASDDGTARAATAAAQGDARLQVLQNATNLGPAAGRNRAIAASRAPFIAILDADDYFLPGRFATWPAARPDAPDGWDMHADNIVFVPETAPPVDLSTIAGIPDGLWNLGLAAFVRGNTARHRRTDRGELGFLKPVLSRAFLDTHALRYDERLWLGEDFDLYVRMLLRGARFTVSGDCGYVARVRATSLSGRHRTGDLRALIGACEGHLQATGIDRAARQMLQAHLREVRARYYLRRFLDVKSDEGLRHAVGYAVSSLPRLLPILRGLARDKLIAPLTPRQPQPERRLLLDPDGPDPRM
ncbi:MAG: glycosyltransferase family 2 protein [Rhodobacteraceae bacterium]|jgi:succinoglycan biosynthesis protein ExoU|nr:glycosyltransferase family 2 protein [Paracoccaceae bacterium]